MKRIVISEDAKADIRAIPQHIAIILTAIHRLAETGAGPVKVLEGGSGEMPLHVGDYRLRFTEQTQGTLRIHAVKHRREAYH